MTPLRLRMTEDMQVRNLFPAHSIHATSCKCRCSPAISASHRRCWDPSRSATTSCSIHQPQEDVAQLDPPVAVAALRFLYQVTLKRGWDIERSIPSPKRPRKLPVVASPEECPPLPRLCARPQAPCHPDRLLRGWSAGVGGGQPATGRHRQPASGHIASTRARAARTATSCFLPDCWLSCVTTGAPSDPTSRQWLFPGASPAHPLTTKAVVVACHKALRLSPGLSQTPHAPASLTTLLRQVRGWFRSRHRHPHRFNRPARSSQPLTPPPAIIPPPMPPSKRSRSTTTSTRPNWQSAESHPVTRPNLEVADVFHRYGDAFRRRFSTSLTTAQRRPLCLRSMRCLHRLPSAEDRTVRPLRPPPLLLSLLPQSPVDPKCQALARAACGPQAPLRTARLPLLPPRLHSPSRDRRR